MLRIQAECPGQDPALGGPIHAAPARVDPGASSGATAGWIHRGGGTVRARRNPKKLGTWCAGATADACADGDVV